MNTCYLPPKQQLSNLYKRFTKAEYYETIEIKYCCEKQEEEDKYRELKE